MTFRVLHFLVGHLVKSTLRNRILPLVFPGMIAVMAIAQLSGETTHSSFGENAVRSPRGELPANKEDASLAARVSAFWGALAASDDESALSLVAADSEELLMARYAFPVEEWRIMSIERIDKTSAHVSINGKFRLPPVLIPIPIRVEQRWRKIGGSWFLELEPFDVGNPLEIIYGKGSEAENAPENLQIKPSVLVMHFLNSPQRGVLYLKNGNSPVEIARIGVDEEKFRLVDFVSELKAGEEGKIVIEYRGTTLEKDLESDVTLHFCINGEESSYEVPVIYNYISPSLKAFFDLHPEEVQQLKPGAVLAPSID